MLFLSGCAFNREWYSACEYAYPEHEMAGCWEGHWHSDRSGRSGSLRAIVTRQGEGEYIAHFHATCFRMLPAEFELPLLVTDAGLVYSFEGEASRGLLPSRVYTYRGTATSSDFQATYQAECGDVGTLTMRKVQTCSQSCGAGDCSPDRCGPSGCGPGCTAGYSDAD